MVKAKTIWVVNYFEGEPKESDFKLVEEDLPPLKDGEIQTEALAWSVDPYQRVYHKAFNFPLNAPMFSGQIAKVIESKNPKFKVGDVVYGHTGWRTHTNVNPEEAEKELMGMGIYKLPDFQGLPVSLGLGTLGQTGCTAYFGLLRICKPKAGETVVISGAAGAVGNHVGQIAKIKGCRVIGITGSDEKVKRLEQELGFDKAINYKTDDIAKKLKEAAPEGVDCYFDNVGGTISTIVLSQMNTFGRISVCGATSIYNSDINNLPKAPIVQPAMVGKQLKMEGFSSLRWQSEWDDCVLQTLNWIKEGKLKYTETVTEGFENLPRAFIEMLEGKNFGKAVVVAKN